MSPPSRSTTGYFLTDEGDLAQYGLFDGAVVGRLQGDHKFPKDPRMSGKHARFILRDNEIYIEDVGARNGVFVNGQRIDANAPVHLSHGDIIELGNHVFCLCQGENSQAPRPPAEADGFAELNEIKPAGAFNRRRLLLAILALGAVAGGAKIFLEKKQTIPQVNPSPALQSILKELVPIGEEYDRLLARNDTQEIKPSEFSSTVITTLLPRLRALQARLAELPRFSDRRADAVAKLDDALKTWAEAWALRANALPIAEQASLERAAEMEKTGFARLDEATQILLEFKEPNTP